MNPVLSIVIPTFNRREFLPGLTRALDRETKDLPPGLVEIVFSNNASTDGTRAYLDSIAGPGIVVHHNETSNYLTNFWTVCQYATGDYCWTMGDDDEPLPGAIRKVLEALGSGADWYFPEKLVIECQDRSKREISLYDLSEGRKSWDLCDPAEVKHWAGAVQTLAGAGGLLSVLIGRRSALLRGFEATKEWGNDTRFPHVAAWLYASEDQSRLEIIPGPTVMFREYNDGLGQNDPWHRIMIDLEAWLRLADMTLPSGPRFWGGSREAFLGILKRHHGCKTIPTMWIMRDDAHPWEEAKKAYLAIGYHPDALETAEAFLVTRQRVAPPATVTYNGGTGNAAHRVANQTLAKLGVNK